MKPTYRKAGTEAFIILGVLTLARISPKGRMFHMVLVTKEPRSMNKKQGGGCIITLTIIPIVSSLARPLSINVQVVQLSAS